MIKDLEFRTESSSFGHKLSVQNKPHGLHVKYSKNPKREYGVIFVGSKSTAREMICGLVGVALGFSSSGTRALWGLRAGV